MQIISTINFHLIKACNFKCQFCYATFNDINEKGLQFENQKKIITELASLQQFQKVNFAGGEPTLIPRIKDLIQHTKSLGFETSIVTNASKINSSWIEEVSPFLDIICLSIDSVNQESNLASGRNQNGKTLASDHFLKLAEAAHRSGIALKINTVASQFNKNEVITPYINLLAPFRWKVLQATKVEGQNETQYQNYRITAKEFMQYCQKNKNTLSPNVKFIPEASTVIQGSYLMVDPIGRFFDSESKTHKYSKRILKIGAEQALSQINPNFSKFIAREGNYSTLRSSRNAHS